MSNILGIDYGIAKIGLALASDDSTMAVPFKILKISEFSEQLKMVKEIIKSEQVNLVVIGLPMSMSNQETAQTATTRRFIKALQNLGVEVIAADERLSSKAAQSQGIKDDDDAVAAMHILQGYLDRNVK